MFSLRETLKRFRPARREGFRTPVDESLCLEGIHEHRFGLPEERWLRLKGRSFWITGAGTGFGRSMAFALALAGARVFVSGRREGKLQELRDVLLKDHENIQIYPVPLDLTDPKSILGAVETVGQTGPLYGLVNNAALPQYQSGRDPLLGGSVDEWDRLFQTNLRGHWLLTRSILPKMAEGGEIRILSITSQAGWSSTAGFGPYSVSKAALNSLSACMAEEFKKKFPGIDIQVNALNPGEAKTEMNQGSSMSPDSILGMALLLLSHPKGGPNGKFFHRDGRHLLFCDSKPYAKDLRF